MLFKCLAPIVLMFASGVLNAATSIPISWDDVRQFKGKRFISLNQLVVRDSPDSDARIVYDLRPLRLVYGVPVAGGWVKVYGVGSRKYPEREQYPPPGSSRYPAILAAAGVIKFDGQRFSQPRTPDTDTYVKVAGYVRAEELGPLEGVDELPAVFRASKAVPSLWPGLKDSRRVPLDPAVAPFSAVVEISATIIGAKQTWQLTTGNCSGFFIENKSTIASAGHCIPGLIKQIKTLIEQKGDHAVRLDYHANVRAGSIHSRRIDLKLLAWRFENREDEIREDWAVFAVLGQPLDGIEPIYLPSLGDWTRQGAVHAAQLGFSGDLRQVKEKEFGASMVHFDTCHVPLASVKVISYLGLETVTRGMNCLLSEGDSGGPLIFFNRTSGRYELLGIASGIVEDKKNIDGAFTSTALARFREYRLKLQSKYGVPPHLRDIDYDGLVPGIAVIKRAVATPFGRYGIYLLDESLLVALRESGVRIDPDLILQAFSSDVTGLDVDNRTGFLGGSGL